jgi:hypothetical protein
VLFGIQLMGNLSDIVLVALDGKRYEMPPWGGGRADAQRKPTDDVEMD